jgi:HicA toxin of bacterial toxin-antitoxin,
MNNKNRKVYDAIFAKPISCTIHWTEVVTLVLALGGDVMQGDGSKVRLDLNGVSLNIHSPHSQKELKRYQVKAVRDFLNNAGVEP